MDINMKKILERARIKYSYALRNYNNFKKLYDEYYDNTVKMEINEINIVAFRMKQEFNTMQEILFIFGKEHTKFIIGDEDAK